MSAITSPHDYWWWSDPDYDSSGHRIKRAQFFCAECKESKPELDDDEAICDDCRESLILKYKCKCGFDLYSERRCGERYPSSTICGDCEEAEEEMLWGK